MARAPFQVLVLPFRKSMSKIQFAVFKRSDNKDWQGIAGGGENNETPLEAAKRESLEEASLPIQLPIIKLDTISTIPVTCFTGSFLWGDNVYVIPEYCFGIDVQEHSIYLSNEHIEYIWTDYNSAESILRFDSNKTALWELNQRINGYGPRSLTANV